MDSEYTVGSNKAWGLRVDMGAFWCDVLLWARGAVWAQG